MPAQHRALRQALTQALLVFLAVLLVIPATASAAFKSGSFYVDTDVSQPTGLQSLNGTAMEYAVDAVALKWDAVAGADRYQLQLASDPTFDSADIHTNVHVDEPMWVPTTTPVNGTHYWRVRATGSSGKRGVWSATKSFSLAWNNLPSNLQFFDDDGTSGSSTNLGALLTWDAVPGASGYDIQIASQQNFADTSVIAYADGHPGNAKVIPHLPDDIYYWRVRTRDQNGVVGPWVVAGSSFTVAWDTLDHSTAYPSDDASTTDVTMGWDPVPGAGTYEVMAATSPGCFYEPDSYDEDTLPIVSNGAGSALACRLNEPGGYETINNWATREIFPQEEIADIHTVEPPYTFPYVYWRVRPVSVITDETETGWEVSGTVKVNGKWMYTERGTSRALAKDNIAPFRINIAGGGPATNSGNDRCGGPTNAVSPACILTTGTQMSPSNAAGDSYSMQMPLMQWEKFPDGMGSKVQVATDENFDNITWEGILRAGNNDQHNMSIFEPSTLPDNQPGTGYWWRVAPCDYVGYLTTPKSISCIPIYYQGSAGIEADYSDGSGARTFIKDANFGSGMTVTNNISDDNMPLIEWDRIDGADHYEIQVSKSLAFPSSDRMEHKTGARMLVPYEAEGNGESTKLIKDGTYWFRVRAIDGNDRTTNWSTAQTFTKTTSAPTILGPSNGAGKELPFLEWQPVGSNAQYRVQWSSRDDFTTYVRTVHTSQTGVLLDDAPGDYYWRVQVYASSGQGSWSSPRTVTVLEEDSLKYEIPRNVVQAGSRFFAYGELTVNGELGNGERVYLQVKKNGSYQDVRAGTTGDSAEYGTLLFGVKPSRNALYRLRWYDSADGKSRYSAPFMGYVKPKIVRHKLSSRNVRRTQRYHTTLWLNRKVSGKAKLQVRYRGRWRTVQNRTLNRQRAFRIYARINRAGRFRSRVLIYDLNGYQSTFSRRWTQKVNDLWTYYRR